MAIKLITPPGAEPISVEEAKTHLRVDSTDEDNLISALITVAREYCEAKLNRALITQTWELWLDIWPRYEYYNSPKLIDHYLKGQYSNLRSFIIIPRPPLQSVSSVKYYDADNVEYTMDAADYFVDTKQEPGRVVLGFGKIWPPTPLRPGDGIAIRFTAGYGDGATDVPQRIKQAMLLLIDHWYENRTTISMERSVTPTEIPFTVNALLSLDTVLVI